MNITNKIPLSKKIKINLLFFFLYIVCLYITISGYYTWKSGGYLIFYGIGGALILWFAVPILKAWYYKQPIRKLSVTVRFMFLWFCASMFLIAVNDVSKYRRLISEPGLIGITMLIVWVYIVNILYAKYRHIKAKEAYDE